MSEQLSKAPTEQVDIGSIVVGERRRRKLGRLEKLMNSIKVHGLIHPIVVRDGSELVVGSRRLEACERLGWKSIPARRLETLSDDELRALEFDENVYREALSDGQEGGLQPVSNQEYADTVAGEYPQSKLA